MRRLLSYVALLALALSPGVSAPQRAGASGRPEVVVWKDPAAPADSASGTADSFAGSDVGGAEGQDHRDYLAWLAGSPSARAEVLAFTQYLQREQVADVLPVWELVRTASMWRECDGPAFQVAPFTEWPHIATTLRFVRSHVVPVIGRVDAVSGYRNSTLNRCAKGAPESAHRHFYALDLVPERALSRTGLVRSLCAIHRFRGRAYDIGLGFYTGLRFHVDSKGFRKWGPDGKGDTSPCVTEV